MNLLRRYTFLTIILVGLFACDSNRWDTDLEGKQADLHWQRFELDLFEKRGDQLDRGRIEELQTAYPQLLPLYSQAIMRFGDLRDSLTLATFQQFTADKNILELLEAVKKTYPPQELEVELKELEEGFLRYQSHFPNASIPKVKSMISAFTYSTVVDDSLLVIGLDNYLGKEFELYPQAGIPAYKFAHFSREFIVADALKAWLLTDFPSAEAQNLLEQMVYQGKITYLLSAFLPNTPEHLLQDYQEEDLQWCTDNAAEVWSHFLEFELFFSTENHKIRKYMGDAPFIPGFPEGSPGRIGQWLGYEIVKEFMDRNKDIDLKELMSIQDANRILRESKYKPN